MFVCLFICFFLVENFYVYFLEFNNCVCKFDKNKNKNLFKKKHLWKMEVLHFFGLWDQKIDSWFMNPEPFIPTLKPSCCCVLQCHQYHVPPTLLLCYNHQAYQTTWLGLQTVDILKQCAYILVPGVPNLAKLVPTLSQSIVTSFYKRKTWYLKWVSLRHPLHNFVLTIFFASATLPAVIYYSELMSILQSILKWQFLVSFHD